MNVKHYVTKTNHIFEAIKDLKIYRNIDYELNKNLEDGKLYYIKFAESSLTVGWYNSISDITEIDENFDLAEFAKNNNATIV